MGDYRDCLASGLCAFKAKDFETAVAELEQATLENQDSFTAFVYLGAAYANAGHYNEAIGAFKRAELLKPGDPRTHYNLGQAYEAAGVPTEALYEYTKALQIDPCYTNARNAFISLKHRIAAEGGRGLQLAA